MEFLSKIKIYIDSIFFILPIKCPRPDSWYLSWKSALPNDSPLLEGNKGGIVCLCSIVLFFI